MKTSLLRLAFCSDLLAVRFFLALGAMSVGVGLMSPLPIFPSPDHAHVSGGVIVLNLGKWATDWVFGALFVVQGAVMMWSLVSGYRNKVLFVTDAILGCLLWTAAFIFCWLIYWPGWGLMILSTVCASWWVLVRYSIEDDGERRCRIRN